MVFGRCSSDQPDMIGLRFGFLEPVRGLGLAALLAAALAAAPLAGAAQAAAGAEDAPASAAVVALATTLRVLDERFIDPEAVAEVFSGGERARLEALARAEGLAGLAPVLDEKLRALGWSHTRFVADGGFEHAFYRSLFETRDPDVPRIRHLRAFLRARTGGAQQVVHVAEGGPAARAGLRRGDLLRRADGAPFDPTSDLAAETVELQLERGGVVSTLTLRPEFSNPHRALIEATRESVRIVEHRGRRFGYLHLWSGTHEALLAILDAAVLERFAGVDGVLLDLRGGFGGAWHDYLDPFFGDRDAFFEVESVDRTGAIARSQPGPRRPVGCFGGPMVVLIDGATRSGKEALAFQFRKTSRAVLVGEPTAGAFSAGLGTVGDGWFLFTAVAEPRLDGRRIEGVGVAPALRVPWPVTGAATVDPQFEQGLATLALEAPPRPAPCARLP